MPWSSRVREARREGVAGVKESGLGVRGEHPCCFCCDTSVITEKARGVWVRHRMLYVCKSLCSELFGSECHDQKIKLSSSTWPKGFFCTPSNAHYAPPCGGDT